MSNTVIIVADLIESKKMAAAPGGRQSIATICEQIHLHLLGELRRYLARCDFRVSKHEFRGDNVEFQLRASSLSYLAEVSICAIAKTLRVPSLGDRFRYSVFTVDTGVSYHPRYGAFEELFKAQENRRSYIAMDRTLTSFVGEKLASWLTDRKPRNVALTLVGEPILGIWVDIFMTQDEIERFPSPPEPSLNTNGAGNIFGENAGNTPSSSKINPETQVAPKSKANGVKRSSQRTQMRRVPAARLGGLCATMTLRFKDGTHKRLNTKLLAKGISRFIAFHGGPVEVMGKLPIDLTAIVFRAADHEEVRLSSNDSSFQCKRHTSKSAGGIGVSCEPEGQQVPVISINIPFRPYKDGVTDRGIVWVIPGSPARMVLSISGGHAVKLVNEVLRDAEAAVAEMVVNRLRVLRSQFD